MDPSRKSQFEQIVVIVLLVTFGMLAKNFLQDNGFWKKRSVVSTPRPIASAPAIDTPPLIPTPPLEPLPDTTAVLEPEPRIDAVYTAQTFRDPFQNLMAMEGTAQFSQLATVPQVAEPTIPAITVEGIVIGQFVQAIIDGEVYEIGDTVQGARIVAIDRKGVTVDVGGKSMHVALAESSGSSLASSPSSYTNPYQYPPTVRQGVRR